MSAAGRKATNAPSSCRPLRLSLLGGFDLRQAGVAMSPPLSVQRLLALLAMQTRPVQRVHVAGILWPDGPDQTAAGNLRTTIWRARRGSEGIISCEATAVSLGAGVNVDVQSNIEVARRL